MIALIILHILIKFFGINADFFGFSGLIGIVGGVLILLLYLLSFTWIKLSVFKFIKHKVDYSLFHSIHKLFILICFAFIIHGLFSGVIQNAPNARIFFFLLTGLTVLLLTHKLFVFLIYYNKASPIKLIEKINNNIFKLIITKPKNYQFKAGQFSFINIKTGKHKKESHPFSIVSSPKDDFLEFNIKNLGNFTSKLLDLRGQMAYVEPALGNFTLDSISKEAKKVLFFAGGIGITPFISMIKANNFDDKKYYLTWSVKRQDFYGENDFLKIAEEKGIKLNIFIEEQHGYIKNLDFISTDLSQNIVAMICGPSIFMSTIKQKLQNNGITNIIDESFQIAK